MAEGEDVKKASKKVYGKAKNCKYISNQFEIVILVWLSFKSFIDKANSVQLLIIEKMEIKILFFFTLSQHVPE